MSSDYTSSTSEFEELFTLNSVEYIRNSDLTHDAEIDTLLKAVSEMENNDAKREGCLHLVKILENVLLDPNNLKTRRIRRSNKVFVKHIGDNELLLRFFVAFGFVVVDEFYVLQVVEFHRLVYAYNKLVDLLKEGFNLRHRSMQAHFFDPFKSYKHSSNVHANSDSFEIVTKDETKSGIDAAVKDISERDVNSATIEDWSPVIKVDTGPAKGKRVLPEANDTFSPPASSLLKMYNVGKNENFESRSRRELETLRAKSEHAKRCPVVEIKVRFPKNTTLSIHVPVKTLVGHIRRNIQAILLEDVLFTDWHLVEFPMRRRISDDRTLLEQDIVFKSILHFTFTDVSRNKVQVVRQEYLDKLASEHPPAAPEGPEEATQTKQGEKTEQTAEATETAENSKSAE